MESTLIDSARSKDKQKKLAEAIAAALFLIWRGHAREAWDRLGHAEKALQLPQDVIDKINAFAAHRAELVTTGIATYTQNQLDNLPSDASASDAVQAKEQTQGAIQTYNTMILVPFMARWAQYQSQTWAYDNVEDPNNPDQSMLQATQWAWSQWTEFPDDCTEAEAASPASYDELMAITGSEPPAHERCLCTLEPV